MIEQKFVPESNSIQEVSIQKNNDSSGESYTILLIEDNEHDVIGFKRAVSRQDQPFKIIHLHRAEGAISFLKKNLQSIDIVISDYQLPGINGLELYALVKEATFQIPFVIVTGTGSEELAVNALKRGVDDYIIKDPDGGYLRLLPIVIPNVIKKYQSQIARKAAEKALAVSEKRYKDLADLLPQTVFEMDVERNVTYLNKNGIRLIGCNQEEKCSFFDHLSEKDRKRFEVDVEKTFDGIEIQNKEYKLRDGKNYLRNVLIYASPIEIDSINTGLRGIIIDITERKKIENEREQLIVDLQEALSKIKTLRGLIPICAACKKIRDDQGYWNQVEDYFREHTDIIFSHSICPNCAKQLYPDLVNEGKSLKKEKL